MKNYNSFGAKIAKSTFFFNVFKSKISNSVSNLNGNFYETFVEVYYVGGF